MSNIEKLQNMIDECNNIVFFGGAGVSTASGIPDFRSEDGLYNGKQDYEYPPEEMLSKHFLYNHPKDFFKFYRDKMLVTGYEPCETHKKLAELEKCGKLKAIITQNIDGLHQKAGSKNVLELHGTIYRNYCTRCKKEFPVEYIEKSVGIPRCDKCIENTAIVRPDVVLYGERLPMKTFEKAEEYVQDAEMLIVAGTSLAVYPAAELVDNFDGKYIVLINKGQVFKGIKAHLVINDDMNEVFRNIHC